MRAVAQGLKEAPVKLVDSVGGILSEVSLPNQYGLLLIVIKVDKMGEGKDFGFKTYDHSIITW